MKETESEVQDILNKAEIESKRIIEDAKKKAELLLEGKKQKWAKEELAKERAELAILRIGHKSELVKLKSQWLDRTFEEASKRLNKMAKDVDSTTYKQFVTGLVIEGALNMKGSKFIIQADSNSANLIKKNLKTISKMISDSKKAEVDLRLDSNPITSVGVIVQSADSRQYYNNTLEARLADVRHRLSGDLYSMLFKEGE
jgi:V/A-type H+-transporting ATPase subunit E